MPQTALPNASINYDWELGQDGWKAGMDNNMGLIDNLLMAYITVTPKSVTTQPGSPANGAAYILATTHNGSQWAARSENDIAIYYTNSGWHFATPKAGWKVYDRVNLRYLWFDGSNWFGYKGGAPISVSGTGTYNPTQYDANQIFYVNKSSGSFNIPADSAVAYPEGTTLTIVNTNTINLVITDTAGVTWDVTDPTTLSPQLQPDWIMECLKTGTNSWLVTRREALP